ncbi:PDZ domain-containing protein [Phytomonospora sp. NPDC050363]|uniref:YlbL family protein n=1 Tax=Phytomonospora sp. NPDC050363 TaxID=3155642 RepID=UPI0033D28241
MKRRGWTVLLGAVLVALLTWQSLSVKVAYVALGPGPTVDTLGSVDTKTGEQRIITAAPEYSTESTGELQLVTVRVYDEVELARAIFYWLSDEYAVVPRDLIYPEDQTDEQIAQQQTEQWTQSQSSAETAALRVLGQPVRVVVTQITPGSAAEGVLAAGDVITAVDGTPVISAGDLAGQISAEPPGTERELTFTRGGKTEKAKVTPGDGGQGSAFLGVSLEQQQDNPFDVKINTESLDIGGPSAGLMFALGIIDRVDAVDLTGGINIAGTGEIDDDGVVGPIGGVAEKVIAAKDNGATVFLTPEANCPAAKGNVPDGLTLVKVGTLDEALNALAALRDGKQPPLC